MPDHPLYAALDSEINERIGIDIGFPALIAAQPYALDARDMAGLRSRYELIKRFQEQTLSVFRASLAGELDPEIAAMVVGELPDCYREAYHRGLVDEQFKTPVFFRTDELAADRLCEIQCSGSGWGLAQQIRSLYESHPGTFGASAHFERPLASEFAASLRSYLGREPVIHHLVDNASVPHGTRYFIQSARAEGLRYFSYDRGVSPETCNFVRSHDFIGLTTHNFYGDRLARCSRGEVFFDLPPTVLFDCKLIMAWPFWSKTRAAYDDEVRGLFPRTSLIEKSGVTLADGEHATIEAFCSIPRRQRTYYVKYAGADINVNWGSKAVFLATTYSSANCRVLMDDILADAHRDRFWILQESVRRKEKVTTLSRDGETSEADAYAKLSAFYGPGGLLGVMLLHKRSHKVHGGKDTIMSVVY